MLKINFLPLFLILLTFVVWNINISRTAKTKIRYYIEHIILIGFCVINFIMLSIN